MTGTPHCTDGSWELSGFYLGGYQSAQKPSLWGNLPQVVVDDFGADSVSGKAGNKISRHHIRVFDKNAQTYEIWYKVEAECKNPAGNVTKGPIQTDPRIKNEG